MAPGASLGREGKKVSDEGRAERLPASDEPGPPACDQAAEVETVGFEAETLAMIETVLRPGETLDDFIRTSVEREWTDRLLRGAKPAGRA